MIKKVDSSDKCQIQKIEKNFSKEFLDDFVNFTSPFTHVFVIEMEEEIIGIIILDIIYERMELVQIKVIKEKRNLGYASCLLEYMLDLAKEKKLENITLEVRCDNDVAIHLYKKYGFEEVSKREKYYHDKDGILMERKMM